jgi:hypothetical protein
VHDLYFRPIHEEFQPRRLWSLSNAFTSSFNELEPIPQYKATAKLAGLLQSFLKWHGGAGRTPTFYTLLPRRCLREGPTLPRP